MTIRFDSPSPYGKKDFQDIIDRLIDESAIKVANGKIKFEMLDFNYEINRFGKRFRINVQVILKEIFITVTEV